MVRWVLWVTLLLLCLRGRQRVLVGRGTPSFRASERTKRQVLPLHLIGSYLCASIWDRHIILSGGPSLTLIQKKEKASSLWTLSEPVRDLKVCVVHM